MSSKPRILVTGAAGFIAYHLIDRLLSMEVPVVGIDNFDPFYPVSRKERNLEDLAERSAATGTSFDFFRQDICELEPDSLPDFELSAVIHLAAKAGVRPSLEQPLQYERANVFGTLKMLEFCRARGISRFVFGSSSSVYGNDTPVPFSEDAPILHPVSPYAATKRAAEGICASYAGLYQMRIPSLRFFTVYGPRQRPDLAIHKFTRLMFDGHPIELFGDGTTSRDYTYVDDIVSGILAALHWSAQQKSGCFEIFNLGGSSPVTLKELVRTIQEATGTAIELVRRPMQPGDVDRTFADISKSTRVLGYRPTTPLAEGIKRFVAWYRESRFPESGIQERCAPSEAPSLPFSS